MKYLKKRRKKGTGLRMVYNGTQSVDKRENPRVNVEVLTVLSPSSNKDSVITGQISEYLSRWDRGEGKSAFELQWHLPDGDEVEFSTAEDYFEFPWSGMGCMDLPAGDMAGIRFGQLSEENKKVLNSY